MTAEWIRFGITAALCLAGVLTLVLSVLGTFCFRFALNRIHAAALTDTLGLMLILAGAMVGSGDFAWILRFAVLLFFQWCTSPLASHMMSKLEYLTDETLPEHCVLPEEKEDDVCPKS